MTFYLFFLFPPPRPNKKAFIKGFKALYYQIKKLKNVKNENYLYKINRFTCTILENVIYFR